MHSKIEKMLNTIKDQKIEKSLRTVIISLSDKAQQPHKLAPKWIVK